jgi:hypothetical protein
MHYDDFSDGIYDTEDGEWISWDWINQEIYRQDQEDELTPEAPNRKEPKANLKQSSPELRELFDSLVSTAQKYHSLTGRYLQIWGELGELYAELHYGIQRHKPGTPGSDGRLGNDFVEIKTISPEKSTQKVEVRRTGNFNKLLVVRITDDFKFESRMIDRKTLCKGKQGSQGKAKIAWQSMPEAKPVS